jgi:Xaa-Pro dipeptidase
MARVSDAGPRLSLQERDHRYTAVRERLRERGVDAVLVKDSNLFYLTNGLPGERFGLLPTRDEPIMVQLNGRHLADISPDVLADAQEWVKDIRAANDASPIVERLKELHLENGTIGVTESRSASGGLSHGLYSALQTAFPNAQLVDVTDIFADLRTCKSDEEVAMIERANLLFDLAIERVHQVARPGMTGKQLVQEGIRAMWEAGGDLDGTFGINIGKVPRQNPITGHFSLEHVVQEGDIATLTAHSHYHHYSGHSDQEIAIGEPKKLYQDMFDAVIHVRDEVLKAVKPGATQSDLQAAYRKACEGTGFRWSIHSQIHQYGIDVPEFPGPAFNADGPRNFVLAPGMIYSISPTIVAPDSDDTVLGGTCLVVTQNGYRELGDRKVEMLVAKG